MCVPTQVPFFKNCSNVLIQQVIHHLTAEVYLDARFGSCGHS